jgi:hypothetical protein
MTIGTELKKQSPAGPPDWDATLRSYPLGFILTGANVSDFDQAGPLLKRHLRPNAHVIMDKGYDRDAIRAYVNQLGATAVIALHPRRSQKPPFDQHL